MFDGFLPHMKCYSDATSTTYSTRQKLVRIQLGGGRVGQGTRCWLLQNSDCVENVSTTRRCRHVWMCACWQDLISTQPWLC